MAIHIFSHKQSHIQDNLQRCYNIENDNIYLVQ